MEFVALIKLAVILFSAFMVLVLVISYASYKVKNVRKSNKKETQQPVQAANSFAPHQYSVMQQQPQQQQYIEQNIQQNQRQKAQVQMEAMHARPKERFQVVNPAQIQDNSSNQRMALAQESKPFYHPRTVEAQRQATSRKAFNLFENYSSGGEKLHKVNLAANFS